jgi:hypothetical protein
MDVHVLKLNIDYRVCSYSLVRMYVGKYLKNYSYHPILWRDSILRPIAPVSSMAGGDDTTRPHHQEYKYVFLS